MRIRGKKGIDFFLEKKRTSYQILSIISFFPRNKFDLHPPLPLPGREADIHDVNAPGDTHPSDATAWTVCRENGRE